MQIVGWMAAAVFFVSFLFSLYGGKSGVSTTDLNSLSHAILASWAFIYCVLLVVFYRHESDATVGTFQWIESRKRNRLKWLLQGVVAALAGAAVAWIVGYGCLANINTYLPGPITQYAAVIVSPARHRYAECDSIKVRLQNGGEQRICVRRRFFGEIVPANAYCAAPGDRAEVAGMSTKMGKSLALLSIDTPSC